MVVIGAQLEKWWGNGRSTTVPSIGCYDLEVTAYNTAINTTDSDIGFNSG